MNTTEWELTLEFHEFDEPWMRFAKGKEKIMININYLPEEPPMVPFDFMAKYFDGDWRQGKEIHRIKITHRFYQVSSNKTKA